NQRDVRKLRDLPIERLVQKDLFRRIGYVVRTANDMGNLHVDVIDHNSQMIGGHAVRAQQHEVFDSCQIVLDSATHVIGKSNFSFGWDFEAKDLGVTFAFSFLDL